MGIGSSAYKKVHTKGGIHQPIWVPMAAGEKAVVYRCAVCSQSLVMDNGSRFVRRWRRKSGWP